MNEQVAGIGMTSRRTRDRLIQRLRDEGIKNENVLAAMTAVPRHLFVDEALASRAYEDTALPIGHGQTISQPYIVACMTEALIATGPLHRVLEIGTGSGYQAAVLAQLADEVYSVERIAALLDQARRRFYQLRLRNVRLKYEDGRLGWAEFAPYDGIIVTAASDNVPEALTDQLADGGRLIIPVSVESHQQRLMLITRHGVELEKTLLDYVRFVPLLTSKS